MLTKRLISVCGLALAMMLGTASITRAQVGVGASTNQVAGPDCNEACGEVSDPYNEGSSGYGCQYTAVGGGQGVGCWYTTTSCGFAGSCSPVWEANLYTDEGRFDAVCGGAESSKLADEGLPASRGWALAFTKPEAMSRL